MDNITDSHLLNIIRYLKDGRGKIGTLVTRKELIKFLEEEATDIRHLILDNK